MTTATFGDGTPITATFGDGTPIWGPNAESQLGQIQFTTTGSTFAPALELAVGSTATVTWQGLDGTVLATGLTPTISFGSTGVRTVRLHCDSYPDITSVNLGFNSGDDPGKEGPGAAYNKIPEAVSGVSGLSRLTGMRQFMAANGNLTGALDLSGCAALRYVECFLAQVTSVVLTGCTSLIRLNVEGNHVSSLDLNPVRTTLKDLRAAIQFPPASNHTVTFATLDGPLPNMWHYCVRDQPVANIVPHSQLPVVEQYLVWNSGQTTCDSPISTVFHDCKAHNNPYDAASVNRILVALATLTTATGGTCYLQGSAAPTGAGITARSALLARGWDVTTS